MAIKRDIVVPANGGLNSDDHISIMPTGDGRYNLNCFDLRKGDHGRKRHIYGDTLISTLVLGSNESIVGGCEDVANDGNIYFIYDSVTYKTRIVRHNVNTNAITTIIKEGQYETPSVLGVHSDVTQLYVDCTVIGDELIWTDGVYDVKSIHMSKFKRLQDRITSRDLEDVEIIESIWKANGDPYVELGASNDIMSWYDYFYVWFFDKDLHEEYGGVYFGNQGSAGIAIYNYKGADINLSTGNLGYIIRILDANDIHYRGYEAYCHLRKAPLKAPTAEFSTETGVSAINLEYSYQFAYSYVYYDGTESVLSPFSKEVYYDLQSDSPLNIRKRSINIGVDVDSYNISTIRLYVRTIGESVSQFYLTHELQATKTKTDIVNYTFSGVNTLGVKSNEDAFKINEAIPYTAECVEGIKDNALVLGGCTEGIEPVNDVTVRLSSYIKRTGGPVLLETKNATYNDASYLLIVESPVIDGEYYFTINVADVIEYHDGFINGWFYNNFKITLTFRKTSSETVTGFAERVLLGIKETIIKTAYSSTTYNRISFDGSQFVTTSSVMLYKLNNGNLGYEGIEQIKVYSLSEGTAEGFKDNATHIFEIIYYDNLGRVCGISNSFSHIVKPFLTQNYDTTGLDGHNWAGVAIDARISGVPPLRAYRYQLAYARPTTYTEQFITSYTFITNGDVAYSGATDYDYEADPDMADFKAIGIDATHKLKKKRTYQYIKGDLLRVVFKGKNKEMVSSYFEVKIEAAKSTAKGYSVVYINKYDWETNFEAMFGTTPPVEIVFEIIRRSNTTENRTFVAIGDTYPIANYMMSNRYHIGDYQTGTEAVISMTNGDVYSSSIVGGDGIVNGLHIENVHPFLDVKYSPRAFGKAFPAQINDSIRYRNIVRNSGKLFAEAKVNRLSVFDALDYVEINSKHGKIYRLISEGNVVSVLQKANVASIYIGGREVATQEGNTEVYASDKVLGSVRDSASQYGIQHKAAVAKLDSGFAFYDNRNGVVCRKYSTGNIPITGRWSTSEGSVDYKMSKYFKELSKLNDAFSFNHRRIRLGYDPSARLILVTTDGAEEGYQTIAFSLDSNRWTFFSDSYYRQFYTYGNKLYAVALTGLYRVLDPDATTYPTSASGNVVCSAIMNVEKPLVKIYEAITLHSPSRLKATVTTETQETQIKPIRWRKEENKYIAYIPKNWLPDRRTYLLEEGKQLQGSTATVVYESTLTEGMDILAWEVWYTPIEY